MRPERCAYDRNRTWAAWAVLLALSPMGLSSKRRVLVVEDDPDYGHVVRQRLQREGFAAEWATTGHLGLFKARFSKPDLILLDIHIPGLNGIVLHKALRKAPQTRGVPLILLTGLDVLDSLLEAAVAGLQAEPVFRKADGLDILVERVRRALRPKAGKPERRGTEAGSFASSPETASRWKSAVPAEARHYEWEGLRFYPELRRMIAGGEVVKLNNKETVLLELFIRSPGVVHSSERLWEAVWPACEAKGWRHTLDSRISSLRKKLGKKRGGGLACQKNEGYVFLPQHCQGGIHPPL